MKGRMRNGFVGGFTFIELVIAAAIACSILGIVTNLFRHFSSQGVQQDRQTVCWATYCRAMGALREDLEQAVAVAFPFPEKLVISTVRIDDRFRCRLGTVTWNLSDERTVTRLSEEGKSSVFSFSGGLGRNERLSLLFRRAP